MKQLIFLVLPCLLSLQANAKTLNEATNVSFHCELTYKQESQAPRAVPLSVVSGYVGDGVSNVVRSIHGGLVVRTQRQQPYNYFEHTTNGDSCDAHIPGVGSFNFYAGVENDIRVTDRPFSYPEDYVGDAISASLVNEDGALLQLHVPNAELNKTYEAHTYYRTTVRSNSGFTKDRVVKVTMTCELRDLEPSRINQSYPNVASAQQDEESDQASQTTSP